jgi:23S rRNA pseudouridine2457 synthase
MEKHRHFKINKPFGYLSQFVTNDVKGHKKKLLTELYSFPEGTMAIGRLDEKSEGLLLLTSDGKLSDTINSNAMEKEYYAQLDGEISLDAMEALKNGVEIGFSGRRYVTRPCDVLPIACPNFPDRSKKIRNERHGPTCWISICVTEGKFRQIRKMTAAVGFPTLRLVRVRVGKILLADLAVGAVEEIKEIHC